MRYPFSIETRRETAVVTLSLDLGLRAAEPLTRLVWNRYPGVIIGVAVYVRGRGVGLRWRRP